MRAWINLSRSWRAGAFAAMAALLSALPMGASAAEQASYPTPEAAITALSSALKANDERALLSVFGDRHKSLVVTGDAANDAAKRAEFSRLLSRFYTLDDSRADRRVLLIGEQAWPFPIPLLREQGGWRFATELGIDEILNRRIGSNERAAIAVLRAYVDAQRAYAVRDRNGDGVIEYARRIGSQPGKFDGLYWQADESKGEEASPIGPLIAESAAFLEGHKPGDAYRGYRFRILTRQGPNAAGGAYNYVINGRMVAGFGMVAYPDVYGESGVMTFIVNHNGRIFEKDLGKNTPKAAPALQAFDPGPGWVATPM